MAVAAQATAENSVKLEKLETFNVPQSLQWQQIYEVQDTGFESGGPGLIHGTAWKAAASH
jgi:hypothetical protein